MDKDPQNAASTFAKKVNFSHEDSESTRKQHATNTYSQHEIDFDPILRELRKIDGWYTSKKATAIEDILYVYGDNYKPDLHPHSTVLKTLQKFDQKGESEGIPPEMLYRKEQFVSDHFKSYIDQRVREATEKLIFPDFDAEGQNRNDSDFESTFKELIESYANVIEISQKFGNKTLEGTVNYYHNPEVDKEEKSQNLDITCQLLMVTRATLEKYLEMAEAHGTEKFEGFWQEYYARSALSLFDEVSGLETPAWMKTFGKRRHQERERGQASEEQEKSQVFEREPYSLKKTNWTTQEDK